MSESHDPLQIADEAEFSVRYEADSFSASGWCVFAKSKSDGAERRVGIFIEQEDAEQARDLFWARQQKMKGFASEFTELPDHELAQKCHEHASDWRVCNLTPYAWALLVAASATIDRLRQRGQD